MAVRNYLKASELEDFCRKYITSSKTAAVIFMSKRFMGWMLLVLKKVTIVKPYASAYKQAHHEINEGKWRNMWRKEQ